LDRDLQLNLKGDGLITQVIENDNSWYQRYEHGKIS
jgi:hypothetical protein